MALRLAGQLPALGSGRRVVAPSLIGRSPARCLRLVATTRRPSRLTRPAFLATAAPIERAQNVRPEMIQRQPAKVASSATAAQAAAAQLLVTAAVAPAPSWPSSPSPAAVPPAPAAAAPAAVAPAPVAAAAPAPVAVTPAAAEAPGPQQESSSPPSQQQCVLVSVSVPNCWLSSEAREQLRLVGAAVELGGGDVGAAPVLTQQPGGWWGADVALPPGQHACRLVIVRAAKQGNGGVVEVCREGGQDRVLRVPHLGAAPPAEAGPALEARLQFGNTGATSLRTAPALDPEQLKAAAAAATQRAAELSERKAALSARVGSLAREVQEREQQIANKRTELQQKVAAELQGLRGSGLVQARLARLQGEKQEQEAKHEAAAAQAASVLPAAQPAGEAAAPGGAANEEASSSNGAPELSARATAKQRLMELLPSEAEAGRQRGRQMNGAEHAAAGAGLNGAASPARQPQPAPSMAAVRPAQEAAPAPPGTPSAAPASVAAPAAARAASQLAGKRQRAEAPAAADGRAAKVARLSPQTRADILKKPNLPVVAAMAAGQLVWASWDSLLALMVPEPARPLVAAACAAAASLPLWG